MKKTLRDLGIFTGIDQVENFANLKNLVPVSEMVSTKPPIEWPQGEPISLPEIGRAHV